MDGRTAGLIGAWVVDVSVARGADADRSVFHVVFRQYVRQSRGEEYPTCLPSDFGQSRFQSREGGGRIVVPRDHCVGCQAVFSRVHARHHAGSVDPCYGRENRMVILEEHALGCELGEVGHEIGPDLAGCRPSKATMRMGGHDALLSFRQCIC